MGRSIKYQVGCVINNCELLSRDYKTSANGSWVATFKCLNCGETFQNRINRVVDGTKGCSCGKKSPAANLAGTVKGVWKIIERAPSREGRRDAYWKCQCAICGKEFESNTANINRRDHAYCDHQGNSLGGRIPSLSVGMIFGNLTIKEYLGDRQWKCQCTCGRFTTKRTDLLTTGKVYACPVCSGVSKGEAKLYDLLTNMDIDFEQQKTFDTCRFKDTNALAKFDFFLSDLNILIEYNGEQHYGYHVSNGKPGWNNEENFKATQERDRQKIEWCKKNDFPLLIIPYTDFNILDEDYLQEKIDELIIKK